MYKIVLVRHGESMWNVENRFTGWADVALSSKGIEEAKMAGIILEKNSFVFDIAYTSTLIRAYDTLKYILSEMNLDIPIKKTWKLNERHYGALQGYNKEETRKLVGDLQLDLWRISSNVRPPSLSEDDLRYPGNDSKYKDLSKEEIPKAENLDDTMERVKCYFEEEIKKEILKNKKIIIVAHKNSLRSLIKYLSFLSATEIEQLDFPNGTPICYELNDKLKIINHYKIK